MTHTPGLALCRRYFHQHIAPALAPYPVAYDAALIGGGSEVLGFDDATSTDHDFYARATLFISPADFDALADTLTDAIQRAAPEHFEGLPTAPEHENGPRGPAVTTAARFAHRHLGFDPRDGLKATDWLTIPSQHLLEVTSGAIFHDGLGALKPLRAQLHFYPYDVWLFMMACQWQRIGQEEHLLGRAVMVGDDLGRRVIAARLVHDAMRLLFLMERRYAPYPKWFGTAFRRLPSAATLTPSLNDTLTADIDHATETWCAVAEQIADHHNRLALTKPLNPHRRPFYTRPFQVIGGERFCAALLNAIDDAELRAAPPIGSVDQWTDNTDLRERPALQREARIFYGTDL